ncbi:MAG: sulfatase-like hydrolase/transferase [Clostridiales bacterium]|nr:sulfatase-like hydrolase/transferase [Clostridiales bacterium]
MKKFGKVLLTILIALLVFFTSLLAFSALWTMYVWPDVGFDQIVFHITSPVGGTESGVLMSFVFRALIPSLAVTAAFFITKAVMKKKEAKKKTVKTVNVVLVSALVVFLGISACIFINRYKVIQYFTAKNTNSDFIKDNYADPEKVSITFPEKKRNLIYIYLESLETTYADKNSGGALDYNCIPELTKIAMENDCFSGDKQHINGARTSFGTTYTMGGMVAQSSGLPVTGGVGNAASQQESFYPGATVLGDILKKEGYNNELMVGSPVEFGGRGVYFGGHGNYKLFDYNLALNNNMLPSKDYKVWWGFEDQKLFAFAKDELKTLASKNEPFNLTLLTVDTHFEDGYVCPLCKDEYGTQYANVMACSSRQIKEFIDWIKQQDFYENTTIVLNGDHLTMDKDFLDGIDATYDRKTFTAVINSVVKPEQNSDRQFCTLDLFPTTLAAMGCKIEGDRLGLGTNLYSSKKTLFEEFGEDYVNTELAKNSEFMNEKISRWDPFDYDTISYSHILCCDVKFGKDGNKKYALIGLSGTENINAKTKGYVARMKGADGSVISTSDMKIDGDRIYNATLEVTSLKMGVPSTLEISAKDSKGTEHLVYSETGLFSNNLMFEQSRKIRKSENADTGISFSEDGKTMTVKASGFANPNDISVVYVYVWDKRSVNNPQYVLLDRGDDANGAYYSANIDVSKMDRSSIRIHLYQRASGGTTKVWKTIKE